ncbi:sulfotransferase 1E1-like [Sycon ciliatum]|uniref:sulfotransferase 1E1-like n=1 Tax=Sycon ciliatum TaxID=27933 RepID=UPI0020ACA5A9|eukprot:scpid69376/ scgid35458/ Sulfotransferase family cytosolic 1B member 1
MATTPEEQKALMTLFGRMVKGRSAESAEAGAQLKTRPSDVIISTSLKSGTTWVQQICHQLRSGGDMDFVDISDVIPFLEMAKDLDIEVDCDQKFEPRMFKTHFWEPHTPKDCRYIIVSRHPYDAAISFFHFVQGWYFPTGDISLNTFTREVFLRMAAPRSAYDFPSPAHHQASWWPRRHDNNVLWLLYEDLKEDLEKNVRRIAAFLDITDEERIQLALRRSTFDYMKEHREHFEEQTNKRIINPLVGLPPDAGKGVGKVRVGGGQRALLNEENKAALDKVWAEAAEPILGAKDYDEWRSKWHAECQQQRQDAGSST